MRRPDHAWDSAAGHVLGQRPQRLVIVDLGKDQVVGRRAHRGRHDPVVVTYDREVRLLVAAVQAIGHRPGDAKDQVVLRLTRNQEVARGGKEVVRAGVSVQAHLRHKGTLCA